MHPLLRPILKKIIKASVQENELLPKAQGGQQGTGQQQGGSTRKDHGQRMQPQRGRGPAPTRVQKAEPTEKEIQDQIKATLGKAQWRNKKGSGAKYRREKRQANV